MIKKKKKTLQKVGTEGTYINIKKSYVTNPQQFILNHEKLWALPLRSGRRQGCTLSPLLVSIVLEAMRQEKVIKGIQTGKEGKLSPFADDLILYIDNPKNATRKLLEINKFGKVAGYEINTQKSLAFLYTNNERSEREIKEKFYLPLPQKE